MIYHNKSNWYISDHWIERDTFVHTSKQLAIISLSWSGPCDKFYVTIVSNQLLAMILTSYMVNNFANMSFYTRS